MIISITGGTGFIGRKLVLHHLSQGDTVRILSRRDFSEAKLPGSVKWYHGDLSRSSELISFVKDADILYHCAGEIRDEASMYRVHVDGTVKLVEAAKGVIGRWVQLSSVGAYGKRSNCVISEQTELKPSGVYEVSKVKSEDLVRDAAMHGGFEFVILRPSIVYGAEMANKSLLGLISIIRRRLFFYIGKPGATMNYIHVDNVVNALSLCGVNPMANGQTYNLSDSRAIERFIAIITGELGIPLPQLRLPEIPIRLVARLLGSIPGFPLTESRVEALTGRTIYLNDKIERELCYRHIVSMETGLSEMVQCLWQADK